MKRLLVVVLVGIALAGSALVVAQQKGDPVIGINVVLNTPLTDSLMAQFEGYGRVRDTLPELQALTMQVKASQLSVIQSLPWVESANPDQERSGKPIDTVLNTNFSNGYSTWDLDAIDVTQYGTTDRQVTQDGTGVYVAVLDTGLLDTWRQYFPQQRIATSLAMAFGGGGGDQGWVSSQPNKWEHDTDSHGTHVTSTILGFKVGAAWINGVAPKATVIPVKVLNQNGSGWSSVIARGIFYVAELKRTVLAGSPVVINMSLGGGRLDAMEKAAIDYAIANGVVIVASAGNAGDAGMGYPGAYGPVISAAMTGWVGQWTTSSWWMGNVLDPTKADDFYIDPYSSRQKEGQDLDVAAPGSWIVGPYQTQNGKTSYYYLTGTSMASPHVAGIVALMLQKNPALTAAQAEAILQSSAINMPAGCRTVLRDGTVCWGTDATGAGLATAAAALAATPAY